MRAGSGVPKTAIELAWTKRATGPPRRACARQRSSRPIVASRLTRRPASKSASAAPLTIAARWKTRSNGPAANRPVEVRRVGDVAVVAVGRDDVVADAQRVDEGAADEAVGAGDEDAHR